MGAWLLGWTGSVRRACPPELHVVIAPFEWHGSKHTALQPDVLVARHADLLAVEGGKFLAEPPVLAVEVLSPSTAD
jgi:Uma2 family endonuclease